MIKQIKIPIYFGDLVLIQDIPLDEIRKKHNIEGISCDAIAWHEVDKAGVTGYMMAFKKCKPSIIAHEADHIANRIMVDRNIPVSFENEETHAYLVGWVVEQCHKFLKVEI